MRQGILVAAGVATVLAGASGAMAQPLPSMAGPPPVYYESRAYYPPPPVVRYGPTPQDAAMPSYEVARILRETGFSPLGGPVRRGDFYTVSAIHPNGDDGRVVIDAYTGRFVRFIPASNLVSGPERRGGDDMVMVYRGDRFPPPDSQPPRRLASPPAYPSVSVAPPPAHRAHQPQIASRTPPAAPIATPKSRPSAAPAKGPSTAQAPPVTAPAAKPAQAKAVAAPPPEVKPVEAKPAETKAPEVLAGPQPTQALPPVQTME